MINNFFQYLTNSFFFVTFLFTMRQPKIFAPIRDDWSIRRRLLASLGFKDYASYLASDIWSSIRLSVMKRENWTCQVCGLPAKDVHHRRYTRGNLLGLLGKDLRHLYALCRTCHESVTFGSQGEFLTQAASSRALDLLLARREALERLERCRK